VDSLEILDRTLIAGIIGDHELEIGMRVDQFATAFPAAGHDDRPVRGWMTTVVSWRASTISSEIADRTKAQRPFVSGPSLHTGALASVAAKRPTRSRCRHVLVASHRDKRTAEARQAMYSMNRVLPQPVGPFSMNGIRFA